MEHDDEPRDPHDVAGHAGGRGERGSYLHDADGRRGGEPPPVYRRERQVREEFGYIVTKLTDGQERIPDRALTALTDNACTRLGYSKQSAVRNPFLTAQHTQKMRSRDRQNYEANGDVYFITSTVAGFVNIFEREELCRIFVDCVDFCQKRGDFILIAWVLMPNHFHLVMKVSGTADVSKVIGNIKRFTSRKIGEKLAELSLADLAACLSRAAEQEPSQDSSVWKPRFDSLVLTNEDTLRQKIEYIHFNPVRKGLVSEASQWPYSSASAYDGLGDQLLAVDTEWQCLGYKKVPSGKDS